MERVDLLVGGWWLLLNAECRMWLRSEECVRSEDMNIIMRHFVRLESRVRRHRAHDMRYDEQYWQDEDRLFAVCCYPVSLKNF